MQVYLAVLAQCYQMEIRWRFRDLTKCFKNEKKNGFDMQFAFILDGLGQKINKCSPLVPTAPKWFR